MVVRRPWGRGDWRGAYIEQFSAALTGVTAGVCGVGYLEKRIVCCAADFTIAFSIRCSALYRR